MRKSLANAVETFAEWRWKTLANVINDLRRVENAVVAITSQITSVAQLASGPDGQAGVFLATAKDEGFWSKARVLGQLVKVRPDSKRPENCPVEAWRDVGPRKRRQILRTWEEEETKPLWELYITGVVSKLNDRSSKSKPLDCKN